MEERSLFPAVAAATQLAYVSDVMVREVEDPKDEQLYWRQVKSLFPRCKDLAKLKQIWKGRHADIEEHGDVRNKYKRTRYVRNQGASKNKGRPSLIHNDTSSREYECRSGIHLRELGSA